MWSEWYCTETAVSSGYAVVSVGKLSLQIRIRINEEQLKHAFVCQQVHYISKRYQRAEKEL